MDSEIFKSIIEFVSTVLDVIGVFIIIGGFTLSTIRLAKKIFISKDHILYKIYRRGLANSILLGLEFLVAGDIIRTVAAGKLSLQQAGVLAIIVLIRALLDWQFNKETSGDWDLDESNK